MRVEFRCCASTTRQATAERRRILELAADCVQILDDIDEPFGGPDLSRGHAADVTVGGGEPRAGLHLAATDEKIETLTVGNQLPTTG